MYFIPRFATTLLLPTVAALLLSADPAWAQRGGLAARQTRTTGQSGSSSQIQTAIQQELTMLQTLLQDVQTGAITLPANSQLTSTQLQTLLQQRISQFQSLLQQLQSGGSTGTGTGTSTGTSTGTGTGTGCQTGSTTQGQSTTGQAQNGTANRGQQAGQVIPVQLRALIGQQNGRPAVQLRVPRVPGRR